MSRRNQIRMSTQEISAYLSAARTIILVSNGKDGYPHPMPMWFAVDENLVITMTTFEKGQKIKNIQRNSKVSLLAESGDSYEQLKGVVIYSHAEIDRDPELTASVMARVAIQRGDIKATDESEAMPMFMKRAAKRVTLRFVPEKIFSWDHAGLGNQY